MIHFVRYSLVIDFNLIYVVGHLIWQEFAEILEVSENTIMSRVSAENVDKTAQTVLLDRDMCTRILAQWVNQARYNNAEKLLNIIKSFESNLSQGKLVCHI